MSKESENKETIFILMLFFFLMSIWGMDIFSKGFHNTDLCHNEKIFSYIFQTTIWETTLEGEIISLDDCYIRGLNQLRMGFFIFGASAFLAGTFYGYLLRGKNG